MSTFPPRPAESISIVVPTRGQPHLVRRLIRSLEHCLDEGGEDVEIIVVDDSAEPARTAIRRLAREPVVRVIDGPRRVGAKRNAGVRAAVNDLVLFIDSDCEATPGLLSAHVRAHREAGLRHGPALAAIAGTTVLAGAGDTWPWPVADLSPLLNAPFSWPERYELVTWAATANLSVRSSSFWKVGGFDEATYTVVGGEDVDLGLRLHEAGYVIATAPEAVAIHTREHVRSLRAVLGKMFLYGRAAVHNAVAHPSRRQRYLNRVLVTGLAATAAMARPTRRRWLGLAAVVSALWIADTVEVLRIRRTRDVLRAAGAVSIKWAFHAGMLAEGLRRGRLDLAVEMFRYEDDDHFRPRSDAAREA